MAFASSSLILSPLGINFDMNKNLGAEYSSLPTVKLFRFSTPCRDRKSAITIVSSRKKNSGGGLASEEKKLLLERYGYDANEYVSQSKLIRRKEELKSGMRNRPEEEGAKQPPRTTHKLLQVLGGKAKRKKLLSLKGMDVRPMMEVVKGAAFGILQAAGGCPTSLRPGKWLDLYSGTGSVGIEAISRGCTEAHFVEMDPWVVSNVLEPNLEHTGFLEHSVIHTTQVENFLKQADKLLGKDGPFDYVSVTPPYMEVDYEVLMDQISKSAVIGTDTFIVVEYPLRTEMLDTCGCLEKLTDRRFGRTHLAIYGPKWAQKPRKS
ncbi:PREDICTED: uncharacterized protein LOC104823923 [Tarenaya hassleriana]|uniref:uncharacterized protein LOC104823923 n=1 Tax=Tarenaya hassleriana TaxID=28532 RepID=UPI00053C32A0|nr:PREDICTED: uncharacterized protein LOC104823923 [Tarenaya hassleriana]